MMIKSSSINLKFANTGKKDLVGMLIGDYQSAVEFYVDYLWSNKIETKGKSKTYVLDVKNQRFDVPKFISSDIKPASTDLSARMLKCVATQACGLVGSRLKKLAKTQFVIKSKQRSGEPIGKLQSKYDKLLNLLEKPNTRNVLPELNSICCNYKEHKTPVFDGLVILSSIWKKTSPKYKHKIILPIKKTKHLNKLTDMGQLMPSFLLSKNEVFFRVELDVMPKKKTGTIEGCDSGMKTLFSLSDRQITPKDKDGYDLDVISQAMARMKKGSNNYRKAQQQKTNYINWSVKQLNLTGIKQINLEKINNIRRGRATTRYLQGFSHAAIESALANYCGLNGVHLNLQSSPYRSQRCSQCGFVHQANRNGKLFKCRDCKFECDADLNAAINHKAVLCDLPRLTQHQLNRTDGFFWKSNGLYLNGGMEFTVPSDKEVR